MPLIKRDRKAEPPRHPPVSLDSGDPNERRAAVRALGGEPSAVSQLDDALRRETDARVREAIFTSLIRIGTSESAVALSAYLRSADAALRSGAIEALQAMPAVAAGVLPDLLVDPDPHVRVRSIEVGRTIEAARATALLCPLLEHDPDPNVCGAAVDVLAENGTAAAEASLRRCAERFADQAFLAFAIDVALRRIAAIG